MGHGRAVRRREEDQVAFSEPSIVHGLEIEVEVPAKLRIPFRHRCAGIGTGRDGNDIDLRMLSEYSQQLGTRVPGPANDTDTDHRLRDPSTGSAPDLSSARGLCRPIRSSRRQKTTRTYRTRPRSAAGC